MHRAAIALASALFAGAPAAATEPGKDWPDIVGRWRAVAFPDGGRPTLPIAAIEFAPCGEAHLCGRIVGADGTCGAVTIEVERARGGVAYGTSRLRGEERSAALERTGDRLVISANPPSSMLIGRSIVNLVAQYRREGPPRCPPGVS